MHKEYKRIVENSPKALLFIHGILGTPNHFAPFIPLVPENLSVYNLLLDGHGKGVTPMHCAAGYRNGHSCVLGCKCRYCKQTND